MTGWRQEGGSIALLTRRRAGAALATKLAPGECGGACGAEREIHEARYRRSSVLADRAWFLDRVGRALPVGHMAVAVVVVEVEELASINDAYGDEVRGRVLVSIGERLRACVSDTETVAHLEHGKFGVLLEDAETPDAVARRVDAFIADMGQPHGEAGPLLAMRAAAALSWSGADAAGLVRDAELALRVGRAHSERGCTIFTAGMRRALRERLWLRSELSHAIANEWLRLHYQPLLDLRSGAVVAVEALSRWTHPTRGEIRPAEFVPIAEESGLIHPLGAWALERACADLASWSRAHHELSSLSVSVNVSPCQLRDPRFGAAVDRALSTSGLDASRLVLEVTESMFVEPRSSVVGAMAELRQRGVRFSIDDFGTGYSSLSSLHQLPVDAVKIDRSFTAALSADKRQADVARAVIGIGAALGVRTVAEGIEQPAELAILQELGCDMGQGFLFTQPLPEEEIVRLLLHPARLSTLIRQSPGTGAHRAYGAQRPHPAGRTPVGSYGSNR